MKFFQNQEEEIFPNMRIFREKENRWKSVFLTESRVTEFFRWSRSNVGSLRKKSRFEILFKIRSTGILSLEVSNASRGRFRIFFSKCKSTRTFPKETMYAICKDKAGSLETSKNAIYARWKTKAGLRPKRCNLCKIERWGGSGDFKDDVGLCKMKVWGAVEKNRWCTPVDSECIDELFPFLL